MRDVRKATKDWQTFSSDAPRRVPIPSEEAVRTVRQYPLEVDPPGHGEYRKLVEPFFLRPKQPEVQQKIDALVGRLLCQAVRAQRIDIVRDFSIPLQSYALTYLLNVDEREAEIWIGWGVHVFKEGDGQSKGAFMERYCQTMFEKAAKQPGDDFFSALNAAEFQGRPLALEEKLGFANIAFAGGRDTIIHTASRILAHLAENPGDMEKIRREPALVNTAAEEFFRMFMPLTHIGRVCPVKTDVHGVEVAPGGRVSLAWSSANRDPEVFEDPNLVKVDRKKNPHISFGFGIHSCLGAHHARAIMRSLIRQVCDNIRRIEIVDSRPMLEEEADYTRMVGYESLTARFMA